MMNQCKRKIKRRKREVLTRKREDKGVEQWRIARESEEIAEISDDEAQD
jgi:hypothetical protein